LAANVDCCLHDELLCPVHAVCSRVHMEAGCSNKDLLHELLEALRVTPRVHRRDAVAIVENRLVAVLYAFPHIILLHAYTGVQTAASSQLHWQTCLLRSSTEMLLPVEIDSKLCSMHLTTLYSCNIHACTLRESDAMVVPEQDHEILVSD